MSRNKVSANLIKRLTKIMNSYQIGNDFREFIYSKRIAKFGWIDEFGTFHHHRNYAKMFKHCSGR